MPASHFNLIAAGPTVEGACEGNKCLPRFHVNPQGRPLSRQHVNLFRLVIPSEVGQHKWGYNSYSSFICSCTSFNTGLERQRNACSSMVVETGGRGFKMFSDVCVLTLVLSACACFVGIPVKFRNMTRASPWCLTCAIR